MSLVKSSECGNAPTLLYDLFDDMRFVNSPWLSGRSVPSVKFRENGRNYEIVVVAPGYDKMDFNISIDGELLTVSAERREEKEEKEDNYTLREFSFSYFSRSFNLPSNTNDDHVDAKYEDGVLKLTIAKKQESNGKQRKKISIT